MRRREDKSKKTKRVFETPHCGETEGFEDGSLNPVEKASGKALRIPGIFVVPGKTMEKQEEGGAACFVCPIRRETKDSRGAEGFLKKTSPKFNCATESGRRAFGRRATNGGRDEQDGTVSKDDAGKTDEIAENFPAKDTTNCAAHRRGRWTVDETGR